MAARTCIFEKIFKSPKNANTRLPDLLLVKIQKQLLYFALLNIK